jgi:hypothetical protein
MITPQGSATDQVTVSHTTRWLVYCDGGSASKRSAKRTDAGDISAEIGCAVSVVARSSVDSTLAQARNLRSPTTNQRRTFGSDHGRYAEIIDILRVETI